MFGLKESTLALSILGAIPVLGAIKNLVKRKSFSPLIFARTFIVYGILCELVYLCFDYSFKLKPVDSMILSLGERWGMFVYKIAYSLATNNYQNKKLKYWKKYNMELSAESLEKLNKLNQMKSDEENPADEDKKTV